MTTSVRQLASVFICGLVFSSSVGAAVWQPISGTHAGNTLQPLYAFEDGQVTPITYAPFELEPGWNTTVMSGEWVLANSNNPGAANGLYSFMAYGPQVDLDNLTINLGSLFFYGANPLYNDGSGEFSGAVFEPMIGWYVGPSYWGHIQNQTEFVRVEASPLVSLVDNGNSTYTATWSYANSVLGPDAYFDAYGVLHTVYNLRQMSLTIQASAVPEPASAWFFVVGLSGLAIFFWRRVST